MDCKVCTKCHKHLPIRESYYLCRGAYRSECKKCMIKRNIKYQRLHKTWKNRFIDNDQTRPYMREYYRNNKAKFAEYRRKFRERSPDYFRSKRDEKRGKSPFQASPSVVIDQSNVGSIPMISQKLKKRPMTNNFHKPDPSILRCKNPSPSVGRGKNEFINRSESNRFINQTNTYE